VDVEQLLRRDPDAVESRLELEILIDVRSVHEALP
jgi:hypothetical protein